MHMCRTVLACEWELKWGLRAACHFASVTALADACCVLGLCWTAHQPRNPPAPHLHSYILSAPKTTTYSSSIAAARRRRRLQRRKHLPIAGGQPHRLVVLIDEHDRGTPLCAHHVLAAAGTFAHHQVPQHEPRRRHLGTTRFEVRAIRLSRVCQRGRALGVAIRAGAAIATTGLAATHPQHPPRTVTVLPSALSRAHLLHAGLHSERIPRPQRGLELERELAHGHEDAACLVGPHIRAHGVQGLVAAVLHVGSVVVVVDHVELVELGVADLGWWVGGWVLSWVYLVAICSVCPLNQRSNPTNRSTLTSIWMLWTPRGQSGTRNCKSGVDELVATAAAVAAAEEGALLPTLPLRTNNRRRCSCAKSAPRRCCCTFSRRVATAEQHNMCCCGCKLVICICCCIIGLAEWRCALF